MQYARKFSQPEMLKCLSNFLPAAVFFIFVSGAFPNNSHCQTSSPKREPRVYTTSRLLTPKPKIDGKLDDALWKAGTWAGDYTQWIPREGARPSHPTELNIQYDDKNLYIAFRAFDDPSKILKMAGSREEFVGDVVGIAFDSYHDYRSGFEFSVTAWGQKCDLIKYNPARNDFNWNPVWKVKVGMEDSAWVAEMEIPLSQLRFSRQKEQVWGMHTSRNIYRLQEFSNWEIQTKTGPGEIYNYGILKGINGIKKSQRLEIMPFTLGSLETMKRDPLNPFNPNGRKWGGQMGLDAKIGISSNFTVDLTVNPDFGQVESDPSVLNLSAYETFYTEKRPFFMEGSFIFDYNINSQSLFYSRRIGHSPSLRINPNDNLFVNSPLNTTILSAVKLSGTTSRGLTVGIIQSFTANEYAKLSDSQGNDTLRKIEPLTNWVVARVQKVYNSGTTNLGGFFTSANRFISDNSLDFLASDAFTGGIDLMHYMKDKEFYLDAKLLGSFIDGSKTAIKALQESSARYYQRPGADYLPYDTTSTSLRGTGGRLVVGRGSKGLWRYSTGISWFSPGTELNDLGYLNSADRIDQENALSYLIIKPFSVFRTLNVALTQFNTWNFNGSYIGSGSTFTLTTSFLNKWTFIGSLRHNLESLDMRILRGGYEMLVPYSLISSAYLGTNPSKKIIGKFTLGFNKSGENSASGYILEPSLTLRPVSNLKFGITASYAENQNSLQYVSTVNYQSQKRYVLGTIDQKTLGLTFRADLYLTPEFSIQYYGSPYVSRGTYSEFKRVTNPTATLLEDRLEVYPDAAKSGNFYELSNNFPAETITVRNPDFNFQQLRSNFVAKWEYRLGSFIYLVWSSEKTLRTPNSAASIGDSYRELFRVSPTNIFLVKMSYWFAL